MDVILSFGANKRGVFGSPLETIKWAVNVLDRGQTAILSHSKWYETKAIGQSGQDNYINGVALLETFLPPLALMHYLKNIERQAGRERGKVWGARCLDIDIISYGSVVVNWQKPWKFSPYSRKRLVLPHPEAHNRPFVMKPLLDIYPDWKHPVLGRSARQIWQSLQHETHGKIMG